MLGMGQDGFQAAFVRLDQALLRLEQKLKDKANDERALVERAHISPNDQSVIPSDSQDHQAVIEALTQRQAQLEAELNSACSALGLAADQVRMVLVAEKESSSHG
jgi:hypothetical protein